MEVAREAGMKFDTAPEPDAPWKRELSKFRKLSDVLLNEKTASSVILPSD